MTTWNVDTIKGLAKYIKCVFYRTTSEQSLKQLINKSNKKEFFLKKGLIQLVFLYFITMNVKFILILTNYLNFEYSQL